MATGTVTGHGDRGGNTADGSASTDPPTRAVDAGSTTDANRNTDGARSAADRTVVDAEDWTADAEGGAGWLDPSADPGDESLQDRAEREYGVRP